MRWITLLFIFQCVLCFSQNSEYDSIYKEVSRKLLASQPEKALAATDYLYEVSGNNTEKTKALMLKASLLRQNGLKDKAIAVVSKADSLATLSQNYVNIARVNGLLSTLYRENGITWSGKAALKKAIEASKKIKDENEAHKFRGNLQQELAYYEMEEKKSAKAIEYLAQGRRFFEKIAPHYKPKFHLAVTDELIGQNYLLLHQTDSAFFYLKQAEKELQNSQNPDSPLKGFIYKGLGNWYMLENDFDDARLHYLKALDVAEASNFYNLKIEVYEALQDYYKTTKDNSGYITYSEKRAKLIEKERQTRKTVANKLIQALHLQENEIRAKSRDNTILIIGTSLLIIATTIGFSVYRRKRDYTKYREFVDRKNKLPVKNAVIIDDDKYYMPKETEELILKKLKNFEKSQCFLDKNTSLNVVSAQLEVNNRYLSYVINKHKQKDFASYVNELRINYIVNCLKKNPAYLKYKISYLADQCGFASHSRFTVTFKKVTGVAPSSFINYLKKENLDKIKTE